MTHLFSYLICFVAGAAFSAMYVDHKWKNASKKLLSKIASLEDGLGLKQNEINNLNVTVISLNSKIKMLDTSLCEKDKELNEILKKTDAVLSKSTVSNENKVVGAPVKKRGPYKTKKKYGRPASNNNSGKKAE